MPNTLAHLFVQGVATRSLLRGADLRWICLGCVIPDLPWILQRVAWRLNLAVLSPYDLRLYAIVQSSLFACLVLCGALAMLSVAPRRVFMILGINSVLHLLLDACQTKFANGVHLFAPFSWELLNLGLFWPESPISVILTLSGLVYFVYGWWRAPGECLAVTLHSSRRLFVGLGLLACYMVLPLALLSGPVEADNHSVSALRNSGDRRGSHVEFDRAFYSQRDNGDVIYTFAGEELKAEGWAPGRSAVVSARGTFLDETTVRLLDGHVHWPHVRNVASYIGLTLVAAIWVARRGRQAGS